MIDKINMKIEELKSNTSRHDFIFNHNEYEKEFEPMFIEELNNIREYIKNNYDLNFVTDTYGYKPAISFIDKKAKAQYSLHLLINFDYELCLGEEFQRIPYTYSSSGAVRYTSSDVIDRIMQNNFKQKKELTIFDFIKEWNYGRTSKR